MSRLRWLDIEDIVEQLFTVGIMRLKPDDLPQGRRRCPYTAAVIYPLWIRLRDKDEGVIGEYVSEGIVSQPQQNNFLVRHS